MNANTLLDEEDSLIDTFLDFSGVPNSTKFTRSDFLKMAIPDDSGTLNFKEYGGWLTIERDGLYVNLEHEGIVPLTPEEAATLSAHSTGNLAEPVLRFPFTISKLKVLLDFTNEHGFDFPLSNAFFRQIIRNKTNLLKSVDDSLEITHTDDNKPDKNRTRRKKFIEDTAIDIWSKEYNNYRITEVAEIILNELINKQIFKVPTLETIKKMIRPHAPELARKHGRPKKH
ncbi:hypothetical protein [Citrobacter braakii]|uniref:hypothetical protein n=1 Tax=Citrobacter braakii TaxID=57706 RepID=UPI003978148F